jgi:hypothetical protein
MAEQLAAAPVSNGGTNIRCSSLAGPAALLLGDAAHAMWPSLGQGANCALEDCVVLDAVLQEAQVRGRAAGAACTCYMQAAASGLVGCASECVLLARVVPVRTQFLQLAWLPDDSLVSFLHDFPATAFAAPYHAMLTHIIQHHSIASHTLGCCSLPPAAGRPSPCARHVQRGPP